MIDFGFVWVDHLLPIFHSPVLMCQSPIQSLPPMPCTEKRPFALLYSHHASFLQCMTHSPCREGLVDDVGKWFFKLASIFCLSRNDEMMGMVLCAMRDLRYSNNQTQTQCLDRRR